MRNQPTERPVQGMSLGPADGAVRQESLEEHARGRPAFEVLLPEGAKQGDKFEALTPIGTVLLAVPEGARAGDYLAFFLDAAFEVTLPEGLEPGQTIEAETPNGKVTIVVPEGAIAGDVLTFFFEATESAIEDTAAAAPTLDRKGSMSRIRRMLQPRTGGLLRRRAARSGAAEPSPYEQVPLPDTDDVLSSKPSPTATVVAAAATGVPDAVDAGIVRSRANSKSADEAMPSASIVDPAGGVVAPESGGDASAGSESFAAPLTTSGIPKLTTRAIPPSSMGETQYVFTPRGVTAVRKGIIKDLASLHSLAISESAR